MGIETDAYSGYWEDPEISAFAAQRTKEEDAPVMVFLKSTHDFSRAHTFKCLAPFLKSARKTCQLFGIATSYAVEVGNAIQYSARKFGQRWKILVLCGHGDGKGIVFEDGHYGPEEVEAKHYEGFSGVVALSCTSEPLAKQIAKVTRLPVFGTKGEIHVSRTLFYQNRPIYLDAKGVNLFYYFSPDGISSGDEFFPLDQIERIAQGRGWISKRFLLEFYNSTGQKAKAIALAQTIPPGKCDAREYILGWDAIDRSDLDQAEHHFKKAIRLGNPNAPITLGTILLKKRERYPEAFSCFERAASYSELAQYHCGYCYKCGLGVEQNDEKAFAYFESAALSGEIDSLYQLGKAYLDGRGVTQSKHLAASYFFKFIDKKIEEIGPAGDLDLLFKESSCFIDSLQKLQSLADEGNSEAFFCFGKVAATRVLAETAIKFGVFFDEKERLAQAEGYYLEARDKGHEEASLQLLRFYCVQFPDLELARELVWKEDTEEAWAVLEELRQADNYIASRVLAEVAE